MLFRSLAVIGVMVVGKIALAWYFKRKGTETASDALLASATEARMDSLISASTLTTALIYLTTGMAFEAWLAALISLAIVKAGFDVLREAISKVLGQRVSGELPRAIKETVRPVDGKVVICGFRHTPFQYMQGGCLYVGGKVFGKGGYILRWSSP